MGFTSALFVTVTAGLILLVGCGGDLARTVTPLPTSAQGSVASPGPAATNTTLPSTVPASTLTTPVATSAPPTSQPAPSQTPTPALAASPAEPQTLTAEALARFAAYVEENRELYQVPGAAVVVVQGGEVVFAQGFGEKKAGGADPVTTKPILALRITFIAAIIGTNRPVNISP